MKLLVNGTMSFSGELHTETEIWKVFIHLNHSMMFAQAHRLYVIYVAKAEQVTVAVTVAVIKKIFQVDISRGCVEKV